MCAHVLVGHAPDEDDRVPFCGEHVGVRVADQHLGCAAKRAGRVDQTGRAPVTKQQNAIVDADEGAHLAHDRIARHERAPRRVRVQHLEEVGGRIARMNHERRQNLRTISG